MTRKKQQRENKMSRQPPLPIGLPPRPSAPAGPRSGDSYRPGASNYYPPNSPPMYHFQGGGNGGGSYRPSYDRPRSPPRYNNYAPGTAPPKGPQADSYRPQGQDNFSFRHEPPPSLDFRQSDTYRPRSPPRHRNGAQENNNYQRRGNSRGMPGGYRGRGGPRMASDREFLKGNRAPTPELMPGMDDEQGHSIRYKPVEEMSDSDEAEMELSDDEQGDESQPPKKRQARTESKAADGDSAPRWSNPDPYTALPPPDESQKKKKDVVKLIRKSRVTTTSESTAKSEAVTDDFISFDFSDDANDNAFKPAVQTGPGVQGAPTGPRNHSRDNAQQNLHSISSNQPRPIDTPKLHSPEENQQLTSINQPLPPRAPKSSIPSKQPSLSDLRSDPALGNRKRNIKDEIIRGPPMIHGPKPGRGVKQPSDGRIKEIWRVKGGLPSTPWLSLDHSDSAKMGVWLHKEIMDWYHYVKPRDFEEVIRTKLVEDLRNTVKAYFRKDADILPFGSFPAQLYLPTSDMDLVCISETFKSSGQKVFGNKPRDIRNFSGFVHSRRLALYDDVEVITKAKVPLVKYVDKITGLKIDISFENDTGLVANETFKSWKATFPAMPILVTLIKHLLAMRGLNEPVNGGIGGFSVTCLVVSLLQNMPQVQSGTMVPEHHLGEILMEFLDLYGNQFDTETTAIQLNPPGYVSKAHANITYQKGQKFCILDPNRPENDISGGSSNTRTIRQCFSNAYEDLQHRMSDLQHSSNRRNQSILGCVLGGNYSSFELQREHLAHIHEKLFGPVESIH